MENTQRTLSIRLDTELLDQINLMAEAEEKEVDTVVGNILRSHVENALHEEFIRHSQKSLKKNGRLVELLAKS